MREPSFSIDGLRASELAEFGERRLHVPLAKPIVRRLSPSSLQWILSALTLIVIAVEAFLIYQLAIEGFTAAAWVRFLLPNLLVGPPAWQRVARLVRSRQSTLVLRENTLRLERPGESPVEIAYRDIAGYWMRQSESPWLRIATKDGRELEVSETDFTSGRPLASELARVLGPRVSPSAIQDRGPRPESPMAARIWDHYADPPPVAMVPGRRYRYIQGFDEATPTAINPILIVSLPMLMNLFPKKGWGLLLVAFMVAVFLGQFLWQMRVHKQAVDDRFELTPEGLWVTRGERRWLAEDLRPATTFPYRYILHGRPMLRYGRGLRTNLFDPRFLEEDD
ncbi:MAG: hypothetical protein ACO1SV_10185 [Fimbriimonas sp.]